MKNPSAIKDVRIREVMEIKLGMVKKLLDQRNISPPGIEKLKIAGDPYRVLISTILSLRTRDRVMEEASLRIFALAPDMETLDRLTEERILEAIYPVGFYRTKARTIKQITKMVKEKWGGQIPPRIDNLLTIPGVGLKTATLVISAGFGGEALCVDTHVHRITNRWGVLRTKSPDETYRILDKALPGHLKARVNPVLVAFGQTICLPASPLCSHCSLFESCDRVEVNKHR